MLFYDDVVAVYLLAFFNPAVRSLRTLEDLSQAPSVQKHLSVTAVCRSTLSDANALFDPSSLLPLIEHLSARLPGLRHVDGDLGTLLEKVIAIDGSFFRVAADVEWALRTCNGHTHGGGYSHGGNVRLNLAYALRTGTPVGCSISGDDGVHEGTAAMALLGDQPGQIYLFDSGVVNFALLSRIVAKQGHFLCNLREHVNFAVQEQQVRVLTAEDRAAGVVSDRIGTLPGSRGHPGPEMTRSDGTAQPLREVRVSYSDRHGQQRELRLVTTLLEVPAAVIAQLYRYRWQIELFFRWLKVQANFRHLTSHSVNGITLSFYIATIAQLLMCLATDRPANKYSFAMMGLIASGADRPEDILPILNERQRQIDVAKARLARKKSGQTP